jgi:two-component sensor histidine kinase
MNPSDDRRIPRRASHMGAWLYVDELMHRTINDYSEILSILRLASLEQAGTAKNDALKQVADRLRASVATFRALSPPATNSLRSLDLALKDLCDSVSGSTLVDRPVTLNLISEPINAGAQCCWQVSLIVAELITNAVRHAFTALTGGSILVHLHAKNGNIHCTVSDSGASKAVVSPGRGTAIVDALASEIGGTVVRHFSSSGSTVMLIVPLFGEPRDSEDQS